MEAVHWGVRGIISDAFTSQPLAAMVEVVGNDHLVYSDPEVGDYYRMLLPGTYNLRFSADGYIPKIINSVIVLNDSDTYLDAQLFPESGINITGIIEDRVSGNPIFARIKFNGNFQFSTTADSSTGVFQISVPADIYQVHISNDRYVTVLDTLAVSEDIQLNYQLQPFIYVVDLDFELDNGNLVSADTVWQWGHPEYGPQKAYSGEKLWGTVLQSSYPDEVDAKLVLPTTLLPEVEGLIFTFWDWMDAETDTISPDFAYDGGIVEISIDNGLNWEQISPQNGYSHTVSNFVESSPFAPGTSVFSGKHGWKEENFALDSYKGKSVQIRFRFGSDIDNLAHHDGWYIDNVAIRYPDNYLEIAQKLDQSFPDQFQLSQNYPNPFNSSTAFNYILPDDHHVNISIYNILGQLVKVLVDNEQTSGIHLIRWDSRNFYGSSVPSGIYFIRMKYSDKSTTRKTLLLR